VVLQDSDLEVSWFSGTGAGGQHRNKHQNSCRIKHLPTGIVRTAQTRERENSYNAARQSIYSAISDKQSSRIKTKINQGRQTQIGSGMRGDKRRTYRFQENRVVDHVTGKSARCSAVIRGSFDRLWT